MVDGRSDTTGHNQPRAGASDVSSAKGCSGAEEARSALTRRSQRLSTRVRWSRPDEHRPRTAGLRFDAGLVGQRQRESPNRHKSFIINDLLSVLRS